MIVGGRKMYEMGKFVPKLCPYRRIACSGVGADHHALDRGCILEETPNEST
jgi:hypothetical protein